MISSRAFRHYDYLLLAACAALIGFGAVLIYSASLPKYEEPGIHGLGHPVARQLLFAFVGALAMAVVSQIDYRLYQRFIIPLYAAGLLFLAAVPVIGVDTLGSRRWISVAGIEVQPSEAMKLVVVLALAAYFAARREQLAQSPRVLLTSLAIVLPPAMLVLLQPDLGSAIVFLAIWLGMATVAGANARHIGIFLAAALLALPFFFLIGVTEYQKERIALFFDPGSDPLGGGFNIIQAEIGIGSGRLYGKGLTDGLQTQNDLVSTQTTDYIFSVAGEELGFIGAVALFALFILFLFRALRAAGVARDNFGELIVLGIVVMVLAQVFINVGVNLRMLPVTGLPLPFISQGGSSLVSLLIGVGVIQSIRVRHRPLDF